MAFAVTIACGMATFAGAAQYRAWGVQRPSGTVSRSGYNQAERAMMGGWETTNNGAPTNDCNCNGGSVAYGAGECGPDCGCGDYSAVPNDPWCGCGPCLLPHLVGGIVRGVGCGLHWLFCCPTCGGYYDLRDGNGCSNCGGGCGSGAYYDAGYDSGCSNCDDGAGGTIETDHPDLMPTPTQPVQKQANPFKDDTAAVYPRGVYRPTRRPTVRRTAARQPSVMRSAYAAPLPAASDPDRNLPHRPRVKKAEILQSLKAAIR
jgi:hypothetical protein